MLEVMLDLISLLYVCIHAGLEVGVDLDVDIDEILVQHC